MSFTVEHFAMTDVWASYCLSKMSCVNYHCCGSEWYFDVERPQSRSLPTVQDCIFVIDLGEATVVVNIPKMVP